MNGIKVAAVQMNCTKDVKVNIEKAKKLVCEAAEKGAKIILLPELFERQYFCQERQYDYYDYAKTLEENDAVRTFCSVAKEYEAVLPVCFYEKDGTRLFNSVAVIDADGKVLGVYRKTHIPDDHFYQEKFYFTPGNTGFKVWNTRYGRLGIGICWDQWFCESARALTINGAQLIFYPTAIGSEPILNVDSKDHWQRCMQGHAATNIIPIIAANRIGLEKVEPSIENGNQTSSLLFYGSSFMTDETGAIIKQASRDKEEILLQEYDLEEIDKKRMEWGLFRDRRPSMYHDITK